jgi:hypothetical protein
MLLPGRKPKGRHIEQHRYFGIAESLKDLVPDITFWPEPEKIHD